MTRKEDRERAELIAKVTDPDYELPENAEIRTASPEGHAETLAMLLDAAATPEERELIRNVGGRPTLDPAGSASVSWRLRVPKTLDQEFQAVVEAEGRSFSDVLRTAAAEYVSAHGGTR